MGTTISDVNFSVDALESQMVQNEDGLMLRYDEEKLFADIFPILYSYALCSGVIHRKADRRAYDKMNSRRRKLSDVSSIFACANITDIQSIERSLRRSAGLNNSEQQHLNEYENRTVNVMRRLQEFQIKSMKYHQREITFLTNNVDPYHHIIDARFSVLERAFLAKIRELKRKEIKGEELDCSLDVKRHFLCYFFGRTDYYMNLKRQEMEKERALEAPHSPKHKEIEKALSDNDKDKADDNIKDSKKKYKRKRKRSKKDSEPEQLRMEDNAMYLGDDLCAVTLENPSYCSKWPSDDSFIERILVLAETLPEALDEMLLFQNDVDIKRSALEEKLKANKKKVN